MKYTPILMVIICSVLAAVAQIFYKIGAGMLKLDIISLATNYPLMIGMALYGLSAILLVLSLKRGKLSVLYPFIALSYIWVAMLSMVFLHESISLLKWAGFITIVVGVSLIGFGSDGL